MSSEMFYPSGDDVDRMIELAIQCGIDNRGTSWPLELCHVRAKLRTLLARTEAGSRPFCYVLAASVETLTGEVNFLCNKERQTPEDTPLYTHPQNAAPVADGVVASGPEAGE